MHQDTSVSTTLIMPKARVAPLKSTTIPRLELVAAYLLAKLLQYIAKLFDIPRVKIFGWTGSEIILCWLRKAPSSLKSFVSNRVAAIQDIIPTNHWHHVPTKENQADLLSHSMRPNQLVKSSLLWRGPDWLSAQPLQWPRLQPSTPRSLPEVKSNVLLISPTPPTCNTWFNRYSSFEHLNRIVAWMRRFVHNAKYPPRNRIKTDILTSEELHSSKHLF